VENHYCHEGIIDMPRESVSNTMLFAYMYQEN